MPSNQRLSEFVAVVTEGSISAGARKLDMPRATLSRRISGLEAELGVRLLHRTTTRLVLTPAGQELSRRARRIEAEAAEAWRSVQRLDEVPRGLLRVSTTSTVLDEMLLAFVSEFPEVRLEVLETSRHVDLVGEGVDVAVRFGRVRDPDLIVRRVGSVRRLVVGSPGYLERCGSPSTPSELSEHACLVSFAGDEAPNRAWPLTAGGTVSVAGPLAGNAGRLLRKAAVDGLGLAFLSMPFVVADLASGRLVPVLEDTVSATTDMSVVFADREYIEPKVRVFVDRAVKVLERVFVKQS